MLIALKTSVRIGVLQASMTGAAGRFEPMGALGMKRAASGLILKTNQVEPAGHVRGCNVSIFALESKRRRRDMSGAGRHKYITGLSASIIGGIIGGLLVLAFTALSGFVGMDTRRQNTLVSLTPGMDILDMHRCPAGQKKIQIVRGVEDKFSRDGDEPAIIRPELLELPYYDYLYNDKMSVDAFRDFDEIGVDKQLLSYVEIPPKIVDGIFVTRIKPDGGVSTDTIRISDLVGQSVDNNPVIGFQAHIPDIMNGELGEFRNDLSILKLNNFTTNISYTDADNLLEYLLLYNDGVILDVLIQDDTRVDFFGFSLCQEPVERRGATLSVDSRDLYGDKVSMVQCSTDPNQVPCDPSAGDTLCSLAMPLGCYKDGSQTLPTDVTLFSTYFIGGSIKVTAPIIGKQLNSLADADQTCAASFGQGWRTLSYHEAGGSNVLAHAKIPRRTRMWVDVKDKPAAACWRNGPQE